MAFKMPIGQPKTERSNKGVEIWEQETNLGSRYKLESHQHKGQDIT